MPSTSSAPTYFEKTTNAKGKSSYLFVKRLNPKSGTFPLFKERTKLKIGATTEAEATREAKTLAAALDLLQEVARKDGKHVTSTKDKNKAAETWVRVVAGVDVSAIQGLKGKATKDALEAKEIYAKWLVQYEDAVWSLDGSFLDRVTDEDKTELEQLLASESFALLHGQPSPPRKPKAQELLLSLVVPRTNEATQAAKEAVLVSEDLVL